MKTKRDLLRLMAVLMLLAPLAIGCSSDDDGDGSTSGTQPADVTSTTEDDPSEQDAGPPMLAGTVTGPVTGGTHGFPGSPAVADLDSAGYVEEEFFLAGTAASYQEAGAWDVEGTWEVEKADDAPYTTRMLVRRPEKAADFNGAVVVEWFNVSSGVDVDVEFGYLAPELLREGYAWVGISAQAAGVNSEVGGDFGDDAVGLKAWDPERYSELSHPGDAWSYDIFSQAGAAVQHSSEGPFPTGFEVDDVIATGNSQSAFRLVTYVNAIHPLVEVFDGYLIQSRNGSGAQLGEATSDQAVPEAARIRTDLDVPVLQLLTETDIFELGAPFPPARQDDGAQVTTWEIAGTAHADGAYLRTLFEQGQRQFDQFRDLTGVFDVANNGPLPQVSRAALRSLNEWVRTGAEPPSTKPLEVDADQIVRDEHGNAQGGVRSPLVDVPIATLTGEGVSLIGATTPFDQATLTSLYPTHDDYMKKFEASVDKAVELGFLLEQDVPALLQKAEAASDRW